MGRNRRRILITGATSGIGLALARKLAARHDVMVTGRMKPVEARDLLPATCLYVQADQSDPAGSAQAIAKALLREGWVKLDNAVLNAGTGFAAPESLDEADRIRTTLDVNLTASILQARALHGWLAKAGGTLTLVGSVAHRGQGLFPAYAASKAGLHGFARALRAEWAGRIAVQVVHPGPTKTSMHEKAGHDPGRLRELFLDPDDVAAMMVFAMSSKRSPQTVSWLRYFSGGAVIGRPF